MLTINARTERIGGCVREPPNGCAAFIGLRRPGVAAWVLLANRPVQSGPPPSAVTQYEVDGVNIWKVDAESLILSEGVALQVDASFLNVSASKQGHPIVTALVVDAQSGHVVGATLGGCA
jgi:hypothetical protein